MRCESKGPKGLAAWMLFVGGVEEFTIRYQIVSAWKQVENHNSFCADVKLRVAHSNHIRNLICFTWVNRNLVNWNLDRIEKKPFADLGHCGAVECDPLYGRKRWGSDEDSLDLDDDQRIDIDELMEREREKKKTKCVLAFCDTFNTWVRTWIDNWMGIMYSNPSGDSLGFPNRFPYGYKPYGQSSCTSWDV